MYEKKCPNCGRSSYSASDKGKWLCPYCSHDLSQVKQQYAGCPQKKEEKKTRE